MKARSPLLLVAAALLAAALGVAASVAWFGGAPALARSPLGQWLLDRMGDADAPATGSAVAAFELPTLDGGRMRIPTPGRAVLVNYWASWCEPCRREMPLLRDFAEDQGPDGVAVLGIALDTPEAARAFLRQTPVDFPILVEAPGPADSSVLLGNGPGVLPYSVLIDAQGRLRARRIGPFTDQADLQAFASEAR